MATTVSAAFKVTLPFSFWDIPRAFFRFLGQFFVEHPVAATGFVGLLLVGAYAAWTSPPRRRRGRW